ncbi:hypothetical protein Hanom_Chr07g00588151 [Helianthus anomalus]
MTYRFILFIMETLVLNFRLDAQQQHIKQLQGDIAEIKTTLKVLEEDLVESGEFQKKVLAWMKHSEKTNVNCSLIRIGDF